MPPKRSKKSPDPNRIPTRPKNAVTHPGHVVHTQGSTRRPDSIIQAEKAEKAAKRAKKEQQGIKQDEAAEAIAEYEQDMVTNDAIEDTQFPRHRDKGQPIKQPTQTAGHRSTKRKIEDRKNFEIVDNGLEVDSDSSGEKQRKTKRTRVRTVPADATRHSDSEETRMVVESDEDPNKIDSEISELTEVPEETPKPKRDRNALRRTETYIERNENLDKDILMLKPEGVEEIEDHTTPKPNEEKRGPEYYTDLEEDEDKSVFVSPLKARKKPAPVANSDIELTETDDGGLEAKRKEKKKMGRQFRAMVQEKRAAMTTTANKKPIERPPAGHSKATYFKSQGDNGFDGMNTVTDNDDESEKPFQPVPSKKTLRVKKVTPNIINSPEGEDDSLQARHNDDESETPFQPVPSKKKTQQVKKVTPKIISSQGEDDSLWTHDNDDESEKPFQPVPSKKTLQVKKVTPNIINSQGEDDSLQARDNDDLLQDHQSLQKRSNKAQEVKKTSHNNRADSDDLPRENKTQLLKTSDDASAKRPKPRPIKKASKTQGNSISQPAEELEALHHGPASAPTTANKSETSRTTANNPVTIEKAFKPPAPKNSKKPVTKMKPDAITIKTANSSLSGDHDEDQKEREEMLASPVKGSDAQAASTALVKLEKTNERPKSRSKAELLQLEKADLITWNNIIEPNYVKYYLSTKSLWSTDAKLLEVAQLIYDEILGCKKPLRLTLLSGPIKLLNQKLNDVRNQTGKMAITNLDANFLDAHGALDDHTQKSAANMRIKFAQDLLEGYQFLFGPDVEFDDGSTMRGKRFFNPLILQTFSSIFKHTVSKAPPPASFPKIGYPIAALTLACVSVERAIRIWAEGIYDANTGKIIAKINPLSNKPSKETAFSSTIWADATNKYMAKIATLKDDVWKELMDEASSYVAFTWENFTAGNLLAAFKDPHATDRNRALFSDEE